MAIYRTTPGTNPPIRVKPWHVEQLMPCYSSRVTAECCVHFCLNAAQSPGKVQRESSPYLKAVSVIDHGRLDCQQRPQYDILDGIEQLVGGI